MPAKSARSTTKLFRSWKQKQSRVKLNSKIRLALFILGFLALVLISGQIVRIFNTIFSPWQIEAYQDKGYSLNYKFNTNLVIQTDSTALVSYSPKDEKITIIHIPDQVYIEAGRFGKWQLRSIYSLGESTRPGFGPLLLKESIASLFGVTVDGYIGWIGPSPKKEMAKLVAEMRQKVFGCLGLLPNLQSDLTLLELTSFCWNVKSVRFDKVWEINLDDFDSLDEGQLADGTNILSIDPIKIDSVINQFLDPAIRGENIPLAIFNATPHPNLAQHASRLITNMGGNVIFIDNFQKNLKTTQVVGKSSPTFQRLNQIFNLCEKKKNCDKIEALDLQNLGSRAEINIFLGEDYAQKINAQIN